MRTALDGSDEGFNDYEKRLVATIREHGWQSTSVMPRAGDDGVSFSYTTGLWRTAAYPEIVVFSIHSDAAYDAFEWLYRAAKSGRGAPVREAIAGPFDGFPAILVPAEPRHFRSYLLSSRWFYRGEDFECLQLVWPDDAGRFPWESGAEERFADSQPDLSAGSWGGLAAT